MTTTRLGNIRTVAAAYGNSKEEAHSIADQIIKALGNV